MRDYLYDIVFDLKMYVPYKDEYIIDINSRVQNLRILENIIPGEPNVIQKILYFGQKISKYASLDKQAHHLPKDDSK